MVLGEGLEDFCFDLASPLIFIILVSQAPINRFPDFHHSFNRGL
jgi:hypothetical protein